MIQLLLSLSSEMEELKDQLRCLQNESLRDKDELQQVKVLYKVSLTHNLMPLAEHKLPS